MTTILNSTAETEIKENLQKGNDVIVEHFSPEKQSIEFRKLAAQHKFHFMIDGQGKNCKFQKGNPNKNDE